MSTFPSATEHGAMMHFLTNLTHRGFLMTIATSAILLTLCGSLVADDKSPSKIFGGKPASTNTGSSRFHDGHGRFAGAAVPPALQPACMTAKGVSRGE